MVVRAHLVLTLITGYIFTVDGLFLQYKSSLNKKFLSLQDIQNEQVLRLPRDIRKLLNNKKRLIVLDRKDKKVKKFLEKLYNVIEDNSDRPAVEKERPNECYRAFGSIYNPKANSKCKGRKPTIKVVKVNVIPVKKPFIDSTRKGSDDDSFSDDVENSKIIHIEHFNARSDKENDKNHDLDSIMEFKTGKTGERRFSLAKHFVHITEPPNKQESSSEENVLIGNRPKRFQVVKNVDESKNTKYINIENDNNSDEETIWHEPQKQTKKPQKTQFVQQIETQQSTDESAEDNPEEHWQKPQKRKQKLKKPQKAQLVQSDDSASDEWQSKIKEKKKSTDKKQKHSDSSVESLESIWTTETNQKKSKKRKREKDRNKKYVYMQGSRFVNSDLESEQARRADRDFNTFLPKNQIWNSDETHHLGYYWYNGPQGHVVKSI